MFGNLMSRFLGGAGGGASVDHADMQDLVRAGETAIVDVREPHEFAAGRIPGAINLPLSQFDPAKLPEGKAIVFVCLSGARSNHAMAIAARAGRTDLRNYVEGMSGWRARGGRVVA
ncbi:MAG: rhodanese-like domain-containing protein [Rhizobiales bacterium]|nr:rhodanese-like domain-containing protein [Hyphomicrobiales bacterium]